MQNQICSLPHAAHLTVEDKWSLCPSGCPQKQERPVYVLEQRLTPAQACVQLCAHSHSRAQGWLDRAELPHHSTALRHRAMALHYGTTLWHGAATAGNATMHHKCFPPCSPTVGSWQQGCGVDVHRKPPSESGTQKRLGTSHPITLTEGACGNGFVTRYGNDCGYTLWPERWHWEWSVLLLPVTRSRRQPLAVEVAAQPVPVQGLCLPKAGCGTAQPQPQRRQEIPEESCGQAPKLVLLSLPFINDSALNSV